MIFIQVKSAVNCTPFIVNNCVEIRFTECEMKGYDNTVFRQLNSDTLKIVLKGADGSETVLTSEFVEMKQECKVSIMSFCCSSVFQFDLHSG